MKEAAIYLAAMAAIFGVAYVGQSFLIPNCPPGSAAIAGRMFSYVCVATKEPLR